jgi:hypothetical protein
VNETEEIDYTYDWFDNLIGREDTTYTSGGSINTEVCWCAGPRDVL